MGPQDVYQSLKEHPDEWFTCKMLRELIGIPHSGLSEALRKLRGRGDIWYRGGGGKYDEYQYKFKE